MQQIAQYPWAKRPVMTQGELTNEERKRLNCEIEEGSYEISCR
jgi:hypothetical protein